MKKGILDIIIERHKAQPVGDGYIDIIVARDNYRDFVSDLIGNGYKVESISWWEWCPNGKENEYGHGGPKSYYYEGWFSELSIDVDDIKLNEGIEADKLIAEIINRIETKTILFSDETITFKQNNCLTPAIWLDVPDEWENKFTK